MISDKNIIENPINGWWSGWDRGSCLLCLHHRVRGEMKDLTVKQVYNKLLGWYPNRSYSISIYVARSVYEGEATNYLDYTVTVHDPIQQVSEKTLMKCLDKLRPLKLSEKEMLELVEMGLVDVEALVQE